MANKIRIKRRATGAAGAPSSLENAELAFNEVDDVLYYGEGTGGQDGTATAVIAIGGSGAFLTLSGDQTIAGNKTVNGNTTFNGVTIVPAPSANGHAATKLYVDTAVAAVTLANTAVTPASYGGAGSVATFTVQADGRLTAASNTTISIASSAVTDFTEAAQDAAAALLTNGTHSGIAATYDDANAKVNLNVDDFTITLGGDLTGSATITNLANATLTATIAANSVALGTDTTGDYVGSVAAGTGITLANTGAEGGTFTVTNAGVTSLTGTANQITVSAGTGAVTLSLPADVTISNNLTVTGDLTIQGNTTTLNTATLTVEDKNVVLANVATPTDVTADGAGISVLGNTTKTLNWVDATDAWTSSEHFNLLSGKVFKINNTTVLSSTALDNVTVDGGTF
ncbi:hypothetical protein EB001_10650 [bacterium]|nr:hypothetical protein [bacterium]